MQARLQLSPLMVGILLLLWVSFPLSLFCADDVVVLKNGDRITGEIRKVLSGDLHIDPPYGGNIFIIEWAQIKTIESKQTFLVEFSGGKRLSGSLRSDPDDPEKIEVAGADETTLLNQTDIISANPFESGFWGRFGGSVDLGTSITKAESTRTGNFRASVTYTTERWGAAVTADSVVNFTKDTEPARRTNVNINTMMLMGQRWFATVGTTFQQSDEQRLKLRSAVSPGMGRFLIRNNRSYLWVAGGAQWANEDFKETTIERKNSAETWAGLEYNAFDMGDLSFLFRAVASPSVTDLGRIRLDGVGELKWDLLKNFYFNVRLSDTFDSRPPNAGSRNDFTFTSGFGWELCSFGTNLEQVRRSRVKRAIAGLIPFASKAV